ncbi:hypothetical protein M758_UG292300 [Ceratodon purpureus]|nr:hypothetical protein M758_UG292300 [Ceratodon purpureus]
MNWNDRWPQSPHWLMQAIQPHPSSTALWKSSFTAWNTTRIGIRHIPPTHPKEILRLPLFGNDLIRQPNGHIFGTKKASNFTTWAKHHMFTVQDLWDTEEQDCKLEDKLKRQTHSQLIAT